MKNSILIIALLLVAFTSCKKDEPTKTELISKEWKIITVDDVNAIDYFDGEEVHIKFTADGVFKIIWLYDGDTETDTGSWNWESNEEKLKVVMSGDQVNWDLRKLTSSEFWFF